MTNHHSPVPMAANATKWLLLCAAATFGSLFAYNTLSPISAVLAFVVAVAVIGLNFAEGYLIRFAVAGWRFGFNRMALLSALGAILISGYSLLAGYNVIESYLIKNQQSALATDYDIAAAKQRINAAKSEALNSFDFMKAQANYMKSAAAENEKIAALLRNKPVNASSVDPSIAATFIAIALEAAIIGLTAFIELFLRPTPLPALVKFNDKLVDWGLNDEQLQNLTISASPAAGTVALPEKEQNRPELVRVTAGAVRDDVPDVFNHWLKAAKSKQIKLTVKDTKKYLIHAHNFKIEDAQNTAGEYLERGYNLGYLDDNSDSSVGQPKYVLADQKLLGQGSENDACVTTSGLREKYLQWVSPNHNATEGRG
ncbi:MAG: hypothetical protein ACPGSM_20465 [Thiolinea sp.]